MSRFSVAVATCCSVVLILIGGCFIEGGVAPKESIAPVKSTDDSIQYWDGYRGMSLKPGEPPTFYAYWVDSEGGFAFRAHEGPPLGPPVRTGEEIVVPATVVTALAETIRDQGIYDDLSASGGSSGYSLRGDQIHLFASRSFTVRAIAEILFLIGLSLGSAILLIVVSRRLRREQAARREAIEARGRMIRVREAERTVLAREIHDGPIQNLHALRLQAHAALLSEGVAPDDSALEAGLRRVSQELRSIMEGLRPPALDRFGFTAALESHAERVGTGSESVAIDVSSEAEQVLTTSGDDLQIGLFRVVQEAVSNAIQHGSQRVQVRVTLEGDTLVTLVSDDGDGFPGGTVPSSDALVDAGHYGLVGMRERAEVLGGGIAFGSSALGGAEVRLRAPIPAPILMTP